MDYFEVWIDEQIPRWSLAITETADHTVDIWAFRKCTPFAGDPPVSLYVYKDGPVVDYNLTAFGAIVVSERLGDTLASVSHEDIELIPAQLSGRGNWRILNVLRCPECIDYDNSIIQFYPEDDDDKTKAGRPRGVLKLTIKTVALGGQHMFLPKGWTQAVIVSEMVRRAILTGGFSNMVFQKVT